MNSPFLKRHFNEIKEVGFSSVIRKLLVLWGLIGLRIELVSRPFFYWTRFLGIRWNRSNQYLLIKLKNEYSKLSGSSSTSLGPSLSNQIKKIESEIKKLLLEIIQIDKKQYNAYFELASLYYANSDFDNFQKTLQTAYEYQKEEKTDEFIPGSVAVGSIGVYFHLNSYIKGNILGLRNPKPLKLLYADRRNFNNETLLKYWSRYFEVLDQNKITKQHLKDEAKGIINPGFSVDLNKHVHNIYTACGIVEREWEKQNRKPLLELTEADKLRGQEQLSAIGIPKSAWFVSFHVRESGFCDQGSQQSEFRNCDIQTYYLAIKSITDAGGWVIRLGDSSMNPLPQMDNVFDYARSGIKSDWMDVFLTSQCKFIVATSSGVYTVSQAFGVPVLMTNLLPTIAAYSFSCRDIFMPKLCWNREEERFLTFKELFSAPVGIYSTFRQYSSGKIEVVDNTEDEITQAVLEMMKKVKRIEDYSTRNLNANQEFQRQSAEWSKTYGKGIGPFNGNIAAHFLSKHVALLHDPKVL